MIDTSSLPKMRSLGYGSYGEVFVTQHQGKSIALKVSNISVASNLIREYQFLRYLTEGAGSSSGICGIESSVGLCAHGPKAFSLGLRLYEAPLDLVIKTNKLSLHHIRYITEQLIRALDHLKNKNIIHTDIKPSNILANKDCTVVLADFGSARFADQAYRPPDIQEQTLWYRAPETALCTGFLGTKLPLSYPMDYWSLGVTLVEAYTGRYLFLVDEDQSTVQHLISRHIEVLEAPYPQQLLTMAGAFENTLYQNKQPNKQQMGSLTSQLLRAAQGKKEDTDPTFTSFQDLIKRLLSYLPYERPIPRQIARHPFIAPDAAVSQEYGVSPASPHLQQKISPPELKLKESALDTLYRGVFCFNKTRSFFFKSSQRTLGRWFIRNEDFFLHYLKGSSSIIQKKALCLYPGLLNRSQLTLCYEDHFIIPLDEYYHKAEKNKSLLEKTQKIFYQMGEALQLLQDKHVVHGNIRSKAILIHSSTCAAKLADFTHARFAEQAALPDLPRMQECNARVPECSMPTPPSYPADMYRLGMTMLINAGTFAQKNIKGDYILTTSKISRAFHRLIFSMTKENPVDRCSTKAFLAHSFFRQKATLPVRIVSLRNPAIVHNLRQDLPIHRYIFRYLPAPSTSILRVETIFYIVIQKSLQQSQSNESLLHRIHGGILQLISGQQFLTEQRVGPVPSSSEDEGLFLSERGVLRITGVFSSHRCN
ncbi:MAG: hypothetical protein FJZ58_00080 [Chlamydiae bacterium]|nr:hypothetical protein [Chlamydiota bacterium]